MSTPNDSNPVFSGLATLMANRKAAEALASDARVDPPVTTDRVPRKIAGGGDAENTGLHPQVADATSAGPFSSLAQIVEQRASAPIEPAEQELLDALSRGLKRAQGNGPRSLNSE